MGKKAVVLSGGGAKGGYQIGVWKVLRQMGFTPDIVVGTSVGALNGALMTLDNFDAALDIWENMSMDSVFQNFVNMSDEENPDRESYIKELAKEAIFKGGADYTPLQERVKSLMDEEKLRTSPRKIAQYKNAMYKTSITRGICSVFCRMSRSGSTMAAMPKRHCKSIST